MSDSKFAPIGISVFDRPYHFRACIESLKKNAGADRTVLYVSSDGPKCDKSMQLVQQVRDYISTIHGFKEVIAFTPAENTRKQIWFETRTKIAGDNERYIFTEDDNIFSPYFLEFINDGLDAFANEPNVAAICGYNFPHFPFEKTEAIALRCFAGWGYGTWREKDLLSRVDIQTQAVASEVFADKKLFGVINTALPHMAPMMRNAFEGNLIAGDVTVCSLLFKRNKVCIFPSKSLVRNTGCDGSGEHCVITDEFSSQSILMERISFEQLPSIEPSEMHTKWLSGYFGGRWAEIRNWTIFWEMNLRSPLQRKLFRSMMSLFGVPRRVIGYLYRCLKRSLARWRCRNV